MNCVICNLDMAECLDYGIYRRGGFEAMVCTEHQPISTIQASGNLKHTPNLGLLRQALDLRWSDIDKPEERA